MIAILIFVSSGFCQMCGETFFIDLILQTDICNRTTVDYDYGGFIAGALHLKKLRDAICALHCNTYTRMATYINYNDSARSTSPGQVQDR
jgi:hypothetical protein